MLKICQRGAIEKCTDIRVLTGECLLAIAEKLSPNDAASKNVDATLAICVKAMDDFEASVRNICGKAAGQLMVVVTSEEPAESKDPKAKQASGGLFAKKKARVYTFNLSLMTLTSPFAKVGASRALREAIAVSVIHFLRNCPNKFIFSNLDILLHHVLGLLVNAKVCNICNKY